MPVGLYHCVFFAFLVVQYASGYALLSSVSSVWKLRATTTTTSSASFSPRFHDSRPFVRRIFDNALYMSKKKGTAEFQRKQFSRNRGKQNTATANNPVRVARIARALRDELSDIICEGDIKAQIYPDEDLLRATSIMHVDVSSGLEAATVHISVLGNSVEKRQVFVWLCENLGQVRYELCKRLKHMKKVPEIRFKLADTQAAADLMAMMEEISETPMTSIELEGEDIDFEEEEDFGEEDV